MWWKLPFLERTINIKIDYVPNSKLSRNSTTCVLLKNVSLRESNPKRPTLLGRYLIELPGI